MSLDFPIGRFQHQQEIVTFKTFDLGLSEEFGLSQVASRRIRPKTRSSERCGLAGEGQLKVQRPAAGQDYAAFNYISQFPDIARPIIILELGHRRPGQLGLGAFQFPG